MEDNHDTLKSNYVKILTDSQAALKALNCLDFKSNIALGTAKVIENLSWRENMHYSMDTSTHWY